MFQDYDKKKVSYRQIKHQIRIMKIKDVKKVITKLELKMNFEHCLERKGIEGVVNHGINCNRSIEMTQAFDELKLK